MKISQALHFVEVYTPEKTYVYFVSPALCRLDAVDDVISRHRENHPEQIIEMVQYSSKVTYML